MLNSFRTIAKTNFSKFLNISSKSYRKLGFDRYDFPDNRTRTGLEVSPYKPQFELTEEERIANEKLPLEDRVLDWNKYMRHKGKLKYSTGTYMIDVEPFPRLKIMMLCDIIMGLNKQLPDSFNTKHYVHEYIKYIMKIVDENESIIDIESKLPHFASAEKLIMALHDQVTLSRHFIQFKPWEQIELELKDFDYKTFFYVIYIIILARSCYER